ncbi:MAG TPA: sialidase family protein [Bryobacteraceae bacterium]|nr:sialidase family protein [Bryobacteraceae bacterium]
MTIDRRHFLLSCAAAPAFAREHRCFSEIDVFQAGDAGYHTYRIPALLVTRKGTLLAFAEARKDDGRDHGNIDLVVKRSEDGGARWSEQAIVREEGGSAKITIGNPCPIVDRRNGKILLPFCRDNNDVLVTESADDGRSWSEPVTITQSVKKPAWTWYATGPGIGIQVERGRYRGRLVIPCDHREEIDGKWVKVSHVFFSDDGGRKWKLGGSAQKHTDECQVAELSDGSLLLNMRNYWGSEGGEKDKGRKRAISRSRDGGATWPDLWFDDTLIEPICQASLIRHDARGQGGKRALLFSNPASRESRTQMKVRASFDDCKTWPVSRTVYEGPSAYSSLAALRDGSIGLLYERGVNRPYEKITYARFTMNWLRGDEK